MQAKERLVNTQTQKCELKIPMGYP